MRNSKSSKTKQAKKVVTSSPRSARIGERFHEKEMNQLKRACKKAGFEKLREFILARCSN